MYSIICLDKRIMVLPSEYVQPTNKVLAFGITDKKQAYEIRDRIINKQNERKKHD